MKQWSRLAVALFVVATVGCDSEGTSVGTGGAGGGGSGGTAGTPVPGFDPIACPATTPDVLTERLCDESSDPGNAPDTTFINCQVETACLGPESPAPSASLIVLTYNMERGLDLDAQLALFSGDPRLPEADVILISEADRGCSRSGGRNVTRELAETVGMNYAFAVEFIELPRGGDPTVSIDAQCEHGNAVLSRFPVGNVATIRHENQKDWFVSAEEPRLGGRITVRADILVGESIVHVYSLHLESGISEADDAFRQSQATEIGEDVNTLPGQVVAGGDANTNFYIEDLANDVPDSAVAEPTVRAFLDAGLLDTHRSLEPSERPTNATFPIVLDLIFANGMFFTDSGLCPVADCGDLSDHVPVWTTITLEP